MNFRKEIKITYIKKFKEEAKETQERKVYPHKSKSVWQSVSYESQSIWHFPWIGILAYVSLVMKT